MKNNFYKIKEYLHTIKNYLFLHLFTILIFIIILSLHGLPLIPLLYACLLISFFLFLYFLYDGYKYTTIKNEIENIEEKILDKDISLPVTRNSIEKNYQQIISSIRKEEILRQEESQLKEIDRLDYYTLWLHQIKTPITAIELLLENATETSHNKNMKEELFQIDNYVNMALAYLKVEDISKDMKIDSYSLLNIVHELIKKYSIFFIHKNIKIHLYDLDIDILTDEKWFSFALEQILSNALKYTFKGSITIKTSKDKEYLIVEDTGIGIASEDIPRLFDKGYTGFNGRLYKKASGLGLSMSYMILHYLFHDIKIKSKIGKGTKVFISLKRNSLEIE